MEKNMWQISQLEVENFRQYKKMTIDFSTDQSKTFTVIKGENGNGKTNIMNAITWCLYGSEKRSSRVESTGDLPIVNVGAIKNKSDGMVITRVKIVLADLSGDKISMERKLSLYVTDKNSKTVYDRANGILVPDKSYPHVDKILQIYGEGGWNITDYFDTMVNEILPEDLATYFLFDGEKLESFFKQVDDTERGIRDVSQVNLIGDAITTLSKVRRKMQKEVNNESPDAIKFKAMLDSEERNLAVIESTMRDLEQKLKTVTRKRNSVEEKIIKIGGDAGQHQKDAKAARKELKKAESMYRESKDVTSRFVLDSMYKLKILPEINKVLKQIQQKTKDGELPPKIRDTFLNEILNKGCCICGGDISIGTASRKKVELHLKKAQYSSISELCTDLKFVLTPMLDVEDIMTNLDKVEKDEEDHKEFMDKINRRYKELELKLKGVDVKEVQRLQDQKNRLEDEITKLNRALGEHDQKKKEVKIHIESLGQKWHQEVKKEKKFSGLVKKLEFCDDAVDALKLANRDLLNDVREQVQRYTKDYFLEFLWKKNTYDDVLIDENYNITAHHIDDYAVREDLSMGEKLVLALSFMAALRKITGFKFPLVIDSPLGKVSGKPRHNIAKALPSFLNGTQVTMLVTNTEYDDEIHDKDDNMTFPSTRETLEKVVGMQYVIDYSDTVRESNIRKVK